MTCEEIWVLISGHLDQENTQAEEAQLREHLEHCPQCCAMMEALEGCDEALRSLEVEPPADLCTNVMETIRQEAPKKRHAWPKWTGVAVAAALLLVVGLSKLPMEQEKKAPDVRAARAMPEVASYMAARDSTGVSEDQIQQLADDRIATIVMLKNSVPELNTCDSEELPNGSVLYALRSEEAAIELRDAYQLHCFQPENGIPKQYYALLLP